MPRKMKTSSKITKSSEILYPIPKDMDKCIELMTKVMYETIKLIDLKGKELKAKITDYVSDSCLDESDMDIVTEQVKEINSKIREAHKAIEDYEADAKQGGSYMENGSLMALAQSFKEVIWAYDTLDCVECDELAHCEGYKYKSDLKRYHKEK